MLSGYRVEAERMSGDKATRADAEPAVCDFGGEVTMSVSSISTSLRITSLWPAGTPDRPSFSDPGHDTSVEQHRMYQQRVAEYPHHSLGTGHARTLRNAAALEPDDSGGAADKLTVHSVMAFVATAL
jgi:hypothetical protein